MHQASARQSSHTSNAITHPHWLPICQRSDLVSNSGVCALWGDTSSEKTNYLAKPERKGIALFFLPGQERQLYAVDNWDPIAQAGIISRGIIAELDGELTIASPLYKHHFRLEDGVCMEDGNIQLATYPLAFNGNTVYIGCDK
ncbi:nitrite reductase small subunit NirD [Microbulbifer sp. PSTR4-B]|uniref:nitrite reductase small subunit NirD n=1 Tax=Microbulbifer sp. PSTR4-B TaxID=3243396 RepID=UPI00403A5EDC